MTAAVVGIGRFEDPRKSDFVQIACHAGGAKLKCLRVKDTRGNFYEIFTRES